MEVEKWSDILFTVSEIIETLDSLTQRICRGCLRYFSNSLVHTKILVCFHTGLVHRQPMEQLKQSWKGFCSLIQATLNVMEECCLQTNQQIFLTSSRLQPWLDVIIWDYSNSLQDWLSAMSKEEICWEGKKTMLQFKAKKKINSFLHVFTL